MKLKILLAAVVALACASARAQVNSGSNGSDGALDFSAITYSTNIVINMADHPTGIYQYTYVNIPNSVTVTFTPNANNTPVVWLVQSNVVISGTVDVSGQTDNGLLCGLGGPGGWSGGNGGSTVAISGQGPGGGIGYNSGDGAGGSYGTAATANNNGNPAGGTTYGNNFLIPLLGGSGGGGSSSSGGGGGGGAILIASSGTIFLNGNLYANGGFGAGRPLFAGGGSGGAIRLVAAQISGMGSISASGGSGSGTSGNGRIRLDTYANNYSGSINGVFTIGSQFVITPSAGTLPQITVSSVGGAMVSPSPQGILSVPDVIVSAQQTNPVPVVVSCSNLPIGTAIAVTIKPASGSAVTATGANNTGTQLSSTATVSLNIPRGGGLIYATAGSN
jgi:hypothetical protein